MKNKVYTRQYYIDKIRGFYHSDLIKVVTGIRRCGKSFFLLSVMEDLKKSGIAEKDIIYLNLDKRGYRKIKTPDALETAIEALITDDDFKYLFIDEVQNVDGFERGRKLLYLHHRLKLLSAQWRAFHQAYRTIYRS